MSILTIIINYIIPVILGGCIGILTTQLKKSKSKNNAIEEGVQALLRNELVECYRKYEIKGELSILDKENIEAMFKQYKNLGGNGTVKHLMDELMQLPTTVIRFRKRQNLIFLKDYSIIILESCRGRNRQPSLIIERRGKVNHPNFLLKKYLQN